jgi:hypothetical protein
MTQNDRDQESVAALSPAQKELPGFGAHRPARYNPYPDYNSDRWEANGRGVYSPCHGPNGEFIEDMIVFKGHLEGFPTASFGSFDVLDMDGNLCFERETRLSPYIQQWNNDSSTVNWEKVDWGELQLTCLKKNQGRFDLRGKTNAYLQSTYGKLNVNDPEEVVAKPPLLSSVHQKQLADELRREKVGGRERRRAVSKASDGYENKTAKATEFRTAILLRSYTGKEYSENDRQMIRSLVTELSLRSGGEYQVYLLVHVRDPDYLIWDHAQTYNYVMQTFVPEEFHGMTVLWNDAAVWDTYRAMTDEEERTVHTAQWLSVQKFSQDNPEYEYVWNWEMDTRYTGHHYDLLAKLHSFSKNQPRKGLWERNERYYIPSLHGNYDTGFRKLVERQAGKQTVWGAPSLPFINPVGPKPPVSNPERDQYEWGVGENADLITVSPIFNPVDSDWIIRDQIWGYNDKGHPALELPRRTTIVTQSRVSKRLLDIMHVENLRGNHVASEMTPQTVALLHGLKAVFAPQPVWFDRSWNGTFLEKWFNGGPRGESGGLGSAMGWGRERRYQGATWYYRAEPPMRLYNNWLGYEDTGIGGSEWEERHGRPCLPPMLLHPIKNVRETMAGFRTDYRLEYG